MRFALRNSIDSMVNPDPVGAGGSGGLGTFSKGLRWVDDCARSRPRPSNDATTNPEDLIIVKLASFLRPPRMLAKLAQPYTVLRRATHVSGYKRSFGITLIRYNVASL